MTVAVALAHLFGFAHAQSDNISAKKTAGAFDKNVAKLFKSHNVVIADRNNHLTRHRDGIRDAVKRLHPAPNLSLSTGVLRTPRRRLSTGSLATGSLAGEITARTFVQTALPAVKKSCGDSSRRLKS
jgi:hypothetical protein